MSICFGDALNQPNVQSLHQGQGTSVVCTSLGWRTARLAWRRVAQNILQGVVTPLHPASDEDHTCYDRNASGIEHSGTTQYPYLNIYNLRKGFKFYLKYDTLVILKSSVFSFL